MFRRLDFFTQHKHQSQSVFLTIGDSLLGSGFKRSLYFQIKRLNTDLATIPLCY